MCEKFELWGDGGVTGRLIEMRDGGRDIVTDRPTYKNYVNFNQCPHLFVIVLCACENTYAISHTFINFRTHFPHVILAIWHIFERLMINAIFHISLSLALAPSIRYDEKIQMVSGKM